MAYVHPEVRMCECACAYVSVLTIYMYSYLHVYFFFKKNHIFFKKKFKKQKVRMWVYEEEVDGRKLSAIINEQNENVKYLPGIKVCASPARALPFSMYWFVCILRSACQGVSLSCV